MTSKQFKECLAALKIDPNKFYTREGVALKMNRSPRTIRGWSELGLKDSNRMNITLPCFNRGGSPEILGKHLIEFLRKTQGGE